MIKEKNIDPIYPASDRKDRFARKYTGEQCTEEWIEGAGVNRRGCGGWEETGEAM